MNYIMYCCFGDTKYLYEMMYSIQTFLNTNRTEIKNYTIIIYTDDKIGNKIIKEFKKLEINALFEILSQNETYEWTNINGKIYMPRVKIKALECFFKKYKAPVLFLDTDTMIFKNLNEIFSMINSGKSYLYTKCLTVSEFFNTYSSSNNLKVSYDILFHYRLCKKILKREVFLPETLKINISGDFNQCNSGVIGLPYSAVNLMDRVLEFSDYLYYNFNFYWAEEFSFSYFLPRNYNILFCDTHVYHYSSDKWCRLLIAKSLDKFYGNDFDEFTALLKKFQIRTFSVEPTLCDIPYMIRTFNEKYREDVLPYYDKTSRHIN